MRPDRLRMARTRAMLPQRPVPDSRDNPAPAKLIEWTKASGPTRRRSHQPWTSARLASIVLLKISAVRANRKRTRSVRSRFVATTDGSIGPGPPTNVARAGTNGLPLGDGDGATTMATGDAVGSGGLVASRTA